MILSEELGASMTGAWPERGALGFTPDVKNACYIIAYVGGFAKIETMFSPWKLREYLLSGRLSNVSRRMMQTAILILLRTNVVVVVL